MLNVPFEPWPSFTQEESEAVSRVLSSNKVNYWTGEEGRNFEKEFTRFAGTKHAIAVANGTLALDLALHGLGIGAVNGGSDKDEVIVTPRSFIASVSCVINAGAVPVFADVDRQTQNITPQSVALHLNANTKAIICVHLAGWPCDMDGFKTQVKGKKIALIEDCAQAHGAKYKGQPVGGLGDVAAWSFCQDKIMTTGGEGGMVTCNNQNLWRRMWAFKDHGKSYEAVYEREHPPGFRWVHESIGTNWRMLEMQAAIGRIQLKRMSEWTAQRTKNANQLRDQFSKWTGPDKPFRLPYIEDPLYDENENAFYKYYLFVQPQNLPQGWNRDKIIASLNEQGLPCREGSCSEIYLEKAFENSPFKPSQRLPIAAELGETSMMLLVHPGVHEVKVSLF